MHDSKEGNKDRDTHHSTGESTEWDGDELLSQGQQLIDQAGSGPSASVHVGCHGGGDPVVLVILPA